MANKKLPGGRKSAGRISTSAQKLVSLKAGAVGVAISELPAAEELTGAERFPVVQGKETRGATIEQVINLIPTGEAGASAYEIWAKAQPEGTDSSEAAYLEFMQGKPGKDGEKGANGISAYQVWAAAQEDGTDISVAAYLSFQEGKQGKDGENGLSAYQIWAGAQEEGADTSESAYLAFQAGKKGDDGASAYQTWLDAGNEGTEDDFLEWLRVAANVDIDPVATNILKNNRDGFYVNGSHPVIPKMVSSTLTSSLDSQTSLPDGTEIYTQSLSMSNPLKITQLGGVGLSTQLSFEPAYYYLDENNNHLPFQTYPVEKKITTSNVNITFNVVMSGTPKRAFMLSDNTEVGITTGAGVPFKIVVHMLIGTTLSQNGMS